MWFKSANPDFRLIAFDERVIFWLQHIRFLPCACTYVALFARRLAYNHYAIAHTHTMQQMHMHKAVTGRIEVKKLLSRRRQSEYSVFLAKLENILQVHSARMQVMDNTGTDLWSGNVKYGNISWRILWISQI